MFGGPIRGVAFLGPFDDPGELVALVVIVAFVLVGIAILVGAVRALRRSVTVARSDPVDAGSVHLTEGVVELEGTARRLEGTVEGPYSGTEALAYTYEKQRKKRRRNSNGNSKTSWATVDSGEAAVPFRVRDGTGAVAVDPEGATFSFDRDREGGSGQTRKYEGRLEPGETVHVYGQKRTATEAGDAPGDRRYFVGDGDAVEDLLISDATESRTVLRYFLKGIGLLTFGAVWTILSAVFLLALVQDVFGIAAVIWAWSLAEGLLA